MEWMSMPDEIQIRFDKSHLVTIGERLYGESLELLRELISNAYDADAENVWIEAVPDRLSVRDDGWGMDEAGLREYFNIGSQNKKIAPLSPRFRGTASASSASGNSPCSRHAIGSGSARNAATSRRRSSSTSVTGEQATPGASRSSRSRSIRSHPTAPR
ncbi:MAG: ATP-binding protein [Candidatus Peribacteraceae bacterium]|nr:ATP-binding protein [Candidatus Peribacteraceae bacterium]MDD5742232.1 ATP-binding protein [Candidatus Peribacteraceae bacterium]